MVNKKHSDRERLFKLIRGDAVALKDIQRNKQIKIASEKIKEFVFLARQKLKEIFSKLIKGEFSFPKLNLVSLNKILVGILAIMLTYLIFDFVGAILFKKSKIVFPAGGVTSKEVSIKGLSPLNYYLGEIGGKDIFNPQRIAKVLAGGSDSLAEPIAGFKLVGVDWGGNPIALIEDTQSGKTYFVTKGEMVKDFKVTEIFRDRVTLRHGNKVVELK